MARQEYLDLDAIDRSIGKFTLHKQEYEVFSLKLRGFINVATLQEIATPDGQDTAGVEHLGRMLDILQEVVPACPREELETLSIEQVNALFEWVNGLGEEQLEKNSKPRRRSQSTSRRSSAK